MGLNYGPVVFALFFSVQSTEILYVQLTPLLLAF